MKVAFAHNVFDRFRTLKETIEVERKVFPDADIFVACNSRKNDEFFNQIENLYIKYYLETPEHKIGCVNGLLLSCNMALEKEFDVLIFSHDDVRITSGDVLMNHVNDVYSGNTDIVYRNPQWIGENYAMMEATIMNRKAVETLFSEIVLLRSDAEIGFLGGSISPELWFYNRVNASGLNKCAIKYQANNYNIEMSKQIGYEHLNIGLRGWKD